MYIFLEAYQINFHVFKSGNIFLNFPSIVERVKSRERIGHERESGSTVNSSGLDALSSF